MGVLTGVPFLGAVVLAAEVVKLITAGAVTRGLRVGVPFVDAGFDPTSILADLEESVWIDVGENEAIVPDVEDCEVEDVVIFDIAWLGTDEALSNCEVVTMPVDCVVCNTSE